MMRRQLLSLVSDAVLRLVRVRPDLKGLGGTLGTVHNLGVGGSSQDEESVAGWLSHALRDVSPPTQKCHDATCQS